MYLMTSEFASCVAWNKCTDLKGYNLISLLPPSYRWLNVMRVIGILTGKNWNWSPEAKSVEYSEAAKHFRYL